MKNSRYYILLLGLSVITFCWGVDYSILTNYQQAFNAYKEYPSEETAKVLWDTYTTLRNADYYTYKSLIPGESKKEQVARIWQLEAAKQIQRLEAEELNAYRQNKSEGYFLSRCCTWMAALKAERTKRLACDSKRSTYERDLKKLEAKNMRGREYVDMLESAFIKAFDDEAARLIEVVKATIKRKAAAIKG